MSDLISREQAIQAIDNYTKGKPLYEYPYQLIEVIRNVPSAEKTSRWIPCEEKLPHDREKVLVCTIGKWIDVGEIIFGRWWSGNERLTDVIAWQPLPQPYRGE